MNSIEQLVTPCGLYCGACPLYLAGKDENYAKNLSEKYGIPVELSICDGCRPKRGNPTPCRGETCATYACAEKKGHFTCVECNEFPCSKLAPAADKAALIPHNTKLYNLLMIKKLGLGLWIEKASSLQNRYFKGIMIYGTGPVLPSKTETVTKKASSDA